MSQKTPQKKKGKILLQIFIAIIVVFAICFICIQWIPNGKENFIYEITSSPYSGQEIYINSQYDYRFECAKFIVECLTLISVAVAIFSYFVSRKTMRANESFQTLLNMLITKNELEQSCERSINEKNKLLANPNRSDQDNRDLERLSGEIRALDSRIDLLRKKINKQIENDSQISNSNLD